MDSNFLQTLLTNLIRAVVTIIFGGSAGYQFLDGRWVGWSTFDSFLKEKKFVLFGQPPLDDLYGLWGAQSFLDSFRHVTGFWLVIGLLALLAMLAHVVYRPSLSSAQDGSRRHWIGRTYSSYHDAITLAVFFVLTCTFLEWPLRAGVFILFWLVTIPALWHLLAYSKDVLKGGFIRQFVYVCLLLFLSITLYFWPITYGRRVFDPEFFVAVLDGSVESRCGPAMPRRGPLLFAHEKDGKVLLCQVCLDQNSKQYINFFESAEEVRFEEAVRLSTLGANFVPFASRSEGDQAVAEAMEVLR